MKKEKQKSEKKLITLIKMIMFLAILSTFTLTIKAQVVSNRNNLESGAYHVFLENENNNWVDCDVNTITNKVHIDYTQKIVGITESIQIALSTLDNNKQRFYYLENGRPDLDPCNFNGSYVSHFIDIPSEYVVKDFDILDGALYFCGYKIGSNSNIGFIAYVFNAADVCYGGEIKYSCIETTTSINKIKAYFRNYRDNPYTPTVAAIGHQDYGDPPYYTMSGYYIPPEKSYDCLIVYSIVEEQAQIMPSGYATCNKLFISHCPEWGMNNTDHETLHDLTITDNYICLSSQTFTSNGFFIFQDSYNIQFPDANDTIAKANYLRFFNKNTLEQYPATKYVAPMSSSNCHMSASKLENIDEDYVAWAFLIYLGSPGITDIEFPFNSAVYSYTSPITMNYIGGVSIAANKVKLGYPLLNGLGQTVSSQPVSTTTLNGNNHIVSYKIRDMKYLRVENSNKLLLLTRSVFISSVPSIPNNWDDILHPLDVTGNLEYYYSQQIPTRNYSTNPLRVPKSIFNIENNSDFNIHWNSINRVPLEYTQHNTYSLFGNGDKTGLIFYNKNNDFPSNSTSCNPQINDGAMEYRCTQNGTLITDDKLMKLCDLNRYMILNSNVRFSFMNFEGDGESNINAECENEN